MRITLSEHNQRYNEGVREAEGAAAYAGDKWHQEKNHDPMRAIFTKCIITMIIIWLINELCS